MTLQILITAGPTHEPIDQVRYLANRSSGKLGLALANAAVDAGCAATLLAGPGVGNARDQVVRCDYQSTADLQKLLTEYFPHTDILLMAAAVADYTPQQQATVAKLDRHAGPIQLTLLPTPDLVSQCAAVKRDDQFIIAWALEDPAVLMDRATEKLKRKRVDAIVANPLKTMGADRIEPTLITKTGRPIQPSASPMEKTQFARWLIDWVISERVSSRSPTDPTA